VVVLVGFRVLAVRVMMLVLVGVAVITVMVFVFVCMAIIAVMMGVLIGVGVGIMVVLMLVRVTIIAVVMGVLVGVFIARDDGRRAEAQSKGHQGGNQCHVSKLAHVPGFSCVAGDERLRTTSLALPGGLSTRVPARPSYRSAVRTADGTSRA
jgi:hypothetical protein